MPPRCILIIGGGGQPIHFLGNGTPRAFCVLNLLSVRFSSSLRGGETDTKGIVL